MGVDAPAGAPGLLPHVAVVVLHWGDSTKTARCLRSLAAVSWPGRLSVILVDNAGTFGEGQHGFAAPLAVYVERPPRNLGFCGGCNLGMARAIEAGADFVLLLNNDATVDPLFLDPLVRAASGAQHAGLVCPQIVHATDPARVWYQGGRFSLWSGIPVQAHRRSARENGQPPREVDYATGCAMLLRRAVVQEVGAFDVRFFAYCEDLDLSIRARQAGFRVVYVPASIVYHDVADSSGPSALRTYYSTRNLIEVMKKHSTWYQWPVFGLNFLARWLAFFALLALVRGRPGQLAALARGVSDFALRRLGERRGGG
jgi:GT2 family glycosyltransferase